MANWKDGQWEDAWEWRGQCILVYHFVPTSSGSEGCSMWKESRGLTLRCPNL